MQKLLSRGIGTFPDRPEQLAHYLSNSWEGATNYMKVIRSRKPLNDFFEVTLSSNLLK
jgi:hypothetical protein